MALTAKQEAFCREYVVDRNATQAAIRAGYSERTAGFQGHDALKKPKVAKRIAELEADIAERNDISVDRLVQELKEIALSDVTQLAETLSGSTFTVKSLEEIPPDLRRCIESIQSTKDGIKIKLWSKTSALDMLMKHLGAYEKDNRQKGGDIGEHIDRFADKFFGETGKDAE
ncbi:MAG: terminase small subunit [Calditrichaeota bacterium]|nr:terminase small subunit [Calditrichota bacterium]